MMWQDFVFLTGSLTSVMFLYPTLRDSASQVPRATSVPSMLIGGAYAATFFTLGMTFSAFGAFAACTMWSLIALFRNPDPSEDDSTRIPVVGDLWVRLRDKVRRGRTATVLPDKPGIPDSRPDQPRTVDGEEPCDD